MDTTLIQSTYTKHAGNCIAAANELGITPTVFMAKIREAESHPEDGIRYIVPIVATPQDLGRPSLRRYIISARHRSWSGWPVNDRDKIEKARVDYDHGKIEMTQGHFGQWVVQYAIPRRKPDLNREPWFSGNIFA